MFTLNLPSPKKRAQKRKKGRKKNNQIQISGAISAQLPATDADGHITNRLFYFGIAVMKNRTGTTNHIDRTTRNNTIHKVLGPRLCWYVGRFG